MKTKEFREMTTEELQQKLKDLRSEHFNLRFSHATGQLSNPMMFSICQSMGLRPWSSKNAFARLKCLHPKNPRYAESGLG